MLTNYFVRHIHINIKKQHIIINTFKKKVNQEKKLIENGKMRKKSILIYWGNFYRWRIQDEQKKNNQTKQQLQKTHAHEHVCAIENRML